MFTIDDITGTLVNYYATCHREAWLYARHIHADQYEDTISFCDGASHRRDTGQGGRIFLFQSAL